VLVTLNPHKPVAPGHLIARIDYAHPVFDAGAIAAQQRLPQLQGARRTWFCGAWTGYGFHEDGLKSALTVAAGLGVRPPWAGGAAPAAGDAAGQDAAGRDAAGRDAAGRDAAGQSAAPAAPADPGLAGAR
jgi:uncharacterized protein